MFTVKANFVIISQCDTRDADIHSGCKNILCVNHLHPLHNLLLYFQASFLQKSNNIPLPKGWGIVSKDIPTAAPSSNTRHHHLSTPQVSLK